MAVCQRHRLVEWMRMHYPRQTQIASLPAVTVGTATRHRIAVHEAGRDKSTSFDHVRVSVVEKYLSAGRPQQRRFLVATDEVHLIERGAPVTECSDNAFVSGRGSGGDKSDPNATRTIRFHRAPSEPNELLQKSAPEGPLRHGGPRIASFVALESLQSMLTKEFVGFCAEEHGISIEREMNFVVRSIGTPLGNGP